MIFQTNRLPMLELRSQMTRCSSQYQYLFRAQRHIVILVNDYKGHKLQQYTYGQDLETYHKNQINTHNVVSIV